jgi:hypothetical protein
VSQAIDEQTPADTGLLKRDSEGFFAHAAPPKLCVKTVSMGLQAISALEAAWMLDAWLWPERSNWQDIAGK